MKEHPILFSGPMVRAILAGNKTMTRRVVKPQPTEWITPGMPGMSAIWPAVNLHGRCAPQKCPYGRPGDRLWVRETWTPDHSAFYPHHPVIYRADNYADGMSIENGKAWSDEARGWFPFKWRPSIHMPRKFSRLLLEVLSMRVERVQDISEEDALAEGSFLGRCPCLEMQAKSRNAIEAKFRQTGCYIHGTEFSELWDSINAKRGYGWDVNPWVWVVEFRRVDP